MQTTASGNQQETCTSNPYGDGLSCTGGADATEQHFTGKDHDAESGLDYFYARYYSETLGRFMTPDWAAAPAAVPYAAYGDPQSLNLYAYVQNNPLTGIDADGHVDGAAAQQAAQQQDAAGQSNQQAQASDPPPSPPGDNKKNGKTTGNIVYRETGGLRGKNKKGGSATDLHKARVAVADVVNNRRKAGIKGGVARSNVSPSQQHNAQYKDSQKAANEAAHSRDVTGGAKNFYLDYGQVTPNWAKGKATTSYGPFKNAAGRGDVLKGADVRIVIVH